jgi:hypothetical protein
VKDETECCKNTILFCGNMALSQLAKMDLTEQERCDLISSDKLNLIFID